MNPRETAVAFHDNGMAALPADQAHAFRMFASSIMADPTFTEGWFKYGTANSDLGALPAAIAAWRRVLELEPTNTKAMNNIAQRLFHSGRNAEAREWVMRLLAIDPVNSHGWCNLSVIQSVDGETKESLNSARRAFELEQSPVIEMALAFAYLYEADWANGLRHMQARYPYALQRFQNYPYPRWDGEDVKAKRLLLVQEQGIGDALSFLRFVPMAAACTGTIELQLEPELVRIAGHILREHPNVVIGPLTQVLPSADYWCSLGDLPVALHLTNVEIEEAKTPTVAYTSLAATVPWKVPGRRMHIGIAWAGSPKNSIDKFRSLKIEQFLELYQVPGIQLYSLQVGDRAADIHSSGCVGLVKDLSPYIRDVMDTCAIMRDLDLVITVESAVRHIAGVLGVECWVPHSHAGGDWRCGRSEHNPLWDRKTHLFRQNADMTWPTVFQKMINCLRNFGADR